MAIDDNDSGNGDGAQDRGVIEPEILPPTRDVLVGPPVGRTFDPSGHVEDRGPRRRPSRWRQAVGGGAPGVAGAGALGQGGGCALNVLRALAAIFGLGLLAAVVLIALRASGLGTAEAVAWLRADEFRGKCTVVFAIAAATPFFVPAGLLAIMPGYVWGTAWGTGLAIGGAALGGLVNMALARWAFGGFIGRFVNNNPGLLALRTVIGERGFRIALALRLSPVAPYSLLAYIAGLAGLGMRSFAVASVLGGIPWTMVYAGFGALLASRDATLHLEAPPDSPAITALRVAGLLFTIAVAWWIGRVARADLARLRAARS